jgi:hypothetical protein
MAMLNMCSDEMRLPMVPGSEEKTFSAERSAGIWAFAIDILTD